MSVTRVSLGRALQSHSLILFIDREDLKNVICHRDKTSNVEGDVKHHSMNESTVSLILISAVA